MLGLALVLFGCTMIISSALFFMVSRLEELSNNIKKLGNKK